MKNYYYLAAALVLASCSSDEFIGENPVNKSEGGMISFSQGIKNATRATKTGADAAAELSNQFVVMGTKGEYTTDTDGKTLIAQGTVFDNYTVSYVVGSANSTASNTAGWEYVSGAQTIKYWDYNADHYDFIAVSGSTVSAITPATATYSVGGAYPFTGSAKIADMVTVKPEDYNKTVTLTFKNSGSQVRLGFYETIPGYSVKDIIFYDNFSSVGGTNTDAKLISSTNNIVAGATYLVYFPVVNDPSNPDNNVAKVLATTTGGGTAGNIQDLGVVNYDVNGLVGTTSSAASCTPYAGVSSNEGNASSLSIRIDYTLVSDDGSGEEIKVKNARAVVPVQYAEWKTNFAYTYLFKLSANTNGTTGGMNPGTPADDGGTPDDPSDDTPEVPATPIDPEGLYAITFDAVVESEIAGFQEIVTTVATPSVTTYQEGVVVTTASEYKADKDIYVTVEGVSDLSSAVVYELSADATEAEVIDALNIDARTLTLTEVTSAVDATITEIPTAGGATAITAGEVALIAKNQLTSGKSYAFVYTVSAPSATPIEKYVEFAVVVGASVDGYYTTTDGVTFTACDSADVAVDGVHYYKKVTISDGVYAVKVIKIQ